MTEQSCILKNFYSNDWATTVREEHRPHQPPPSFPFPLDLPPADWIKSPKRQALDNYSARITACGLTGADMAVEYLLDKYRNNLALNTIKQASGVVLSFLHFISEAGINFFELTRQDLCAFVEHEQDRGLKPNSVASNLRDVYTFISFLVEREILSQAVMHKKIRLKLPELLPRAIPPEDMAGLLSAISNVRNRALILLLLRTGLRIGELLNVKIADIVLPERKILIYLAEKNYQGRVVYFGEDAERALNEWLEIRNTQNDYLFYSPSRKKLSYAAARKLMVKILEKADLSHKGYTLHSLRHTFATDMLNAGLRLEILQQLLGHQSIEITMRYARMSDATRETEYFRAMTIIEKGGHYETHRVSSQLQTVFEEKKLLTSHCKKLHA